MPSGVGHHPRSRLPALWNRPDRQPLKMHVPLVIEAPQPEHARVVVHL